MLLATIHDNAPYQNHKNKNNEYALYSKTTPIRPINNRTDPFSYQKDEFQDQKMQPSAFILSVITRANLKTAPIVLKS